MFTLIKYQISGAGSTIYCSWLRVHFNDKFMSRLNAFLSSATEIPRCWFMVALNQCRYVYITLLGEATFKYEGMRILSVIVNDELLLSYE